MTKTNEGLLQLVDYIAGLDAIQANLTQIAAHLRGLIVNDTLSTELVTFDTNGVFSRDWTTAYASVVVVNLSGGTVTVTGEPPGEKVPTGGVGVWKVPTGGSAVVNLTSSVLTIYGPAGGQANVAVFTKSLPPNAIPGPSAGSATNLNKAIVRQTGATTRNIPAGRRSYSVTVIAAASGASPTLDGVALPVGATVAFAVDQPGDSLPAAILTTVAGDDVVYTETF